MEDRKHKKVFTLLACFAAANACGMFAGEPIEATASFSGDWQLDISAKTPSRTALAASFLIDKPDKVSVKEERCERLPDFNPAAWQWLKGYVLKRLAAQEAPVGGALSPNSLRLAASPGASVYVEGKDYKVDPTWGCVGCLPGGTIPAQGAVFCSYDYFQQRLDTVALSADGTKLLLKRGTPALCQPKPPTLAAGETPVVNIHVTGNLSKLSQDNVFPILETSFPATLAAKDAGAAEQLLLKTTRKLRGGGHLKILAWGDSVTDGGYLPGKGENRWQAQFAARLKARYPKADIELVTEAWGGHNTAQYLAEPPGSPHNYREKILAAKPDLIITEFVNDAYLKPDETIERYGKLLADFKGIGAEWIINTPHYILPGWMGLKSQRGVDADPREYVKKLREFAAKNHVALADASLRYGRLWRQGIPYMTLMTNSVNHPGPSGMAIFADALINLFP